jgi:hypothetical protein
MNLPIDYLTVPFGLPRVQENTFDDSHKSSRWFFRQDYILDALLQRNRNLSSKIFQACRPPKADSKVLPADWQRASEFRRISFSQ